LLISTTSVRRKVTRRRENPMLKIVRAVLFLFRPTFFQMIFQYFTINPQNPPPGRQDTKISRKVLLVFW
jgi:hypothetical protein